MSKIPDQVVDPEILDQVDDFDDQVENRRDEEAAALIDAMIIPMVPQVGTHSPLGKSGSGRKKTTKVKQEVRQYPEDFDGCTPPDKIWSDVHIGNKEYQIYNRKFTGILHLAGYGSKEAPLDVMFVSPCVLLEELESKLGSGMMRGGPGGMLRDELARVGISPEQWYYTALVKYNVAKLKPRAMDIKWCLKAFENEVELLKPKLIVCLGKVVFDFFMGSRRFAMKDVQGAFFKSEKYKCSIYPMDSLIVPAYRPEFLDRFAVDLRMVKREIDDTKGVVRVQVPEDYCEIRTTERLQNVITMLRERKLRELAVDAEWHGQTAYGGRLRSFQFCWQPGQAAYLRLMDDKLKYAFDQPIEVVREIMAPYFNDPAVRFIGHNASADMPWMHEHLGIEVYRRFDFDTMYAQHTIDEYADLKLERLSVKFTDLGRYDLDLLLWKKSHKFDEEDNDGYGKVPDKILIPYATRDVDCTFRCRVPLYRSLVYTGLLGYYRRFLLPFVTDGFYEMMSCGLPVNLDHLNEMREVFIRNRDALFHDFRVDLHQEASRFLMAALKHAGVPDYRDVTTQIYATLKANEGDARGAALEIFKSSLGDPKKIEDAMDCFDHACDSIGFNINSRPQVARWLFKIKNFEPVKTTKQNGIHLSWEKVKAMDKGEQTKWTPSTDKQVVKIYAERDPMVARLQELSAVATMVKSFLREPDEKGREQGMHKWIQADGRIHANFALTETARPRSWKPNILNFPKVITKPIEAGFQRINERLARETRERMLAESTDPEKDRAAIEAEVFRLMHKPTSLRSAIQAPEGWCVVDMDLKTAEIVALAYQSNDQNMIKVLTEPDVQFARIDKDNPKKVVRIAYNENEGIPESEWDPALLVSPDDPRILRREDGSIIHPKRDLHWEMGTSVAGKPREKCDERMVRDGCGKVGNFSIPYGATEMLLERMIESNTGLKPDEGTGKKMISSWMERYVEAALFQYKLEKTVADPGYWKSLSGRVRHFIYAPLEELQEFSDRKKKSIFSGLARQARNFPCQELVAATTGKALLMFIEERRKLGLASRVGILLYDAMTAFVPLTELRVAAPLLKDCLTVRNRWDTAGGTFNFEVDVSIGFRWGVKPTSEEKKLIETYLKA